MRNNLEVFCVDRAYPSLMYSDQFNLSYLSNKNYAQSEIFRGLMFHNVHLFTAKIDQTQTLMSTKRAILGLFLRSFFLVTM